MYVHKAGLQIDLQIFPPRPNTTRHNTGTATAVYGIKSSLTVGKCVFIIFLHMLFKTVNLVVIHLSCSNCFNLHCYIFSYYIL